MKGEIVKEYLEHPEWGSLPSLTLARLIYKDNVEVFKDVDDVRGKIRYYRGQRGKAQRHRATHKAEPAEHAKALGVANPFGLPESDEEIGSRSFYPKAMTASFYCRTFTFLTITSKHSRKLLSTEKRRR
jgi:hypothetical protein